MPIRAVTQRELPVPGRGIGVHARDAEIEDLQAAVQVHHEVGGLDVAVDDAGLVGVSQSGAEFRQQAELHAQRHRRVPAVLSASVSPRTYSITMNGESSYSPES